MILKNVEDKFTFSLGSKMAKFYLMWKAIHSFHFVRSFVTLEWPKNITFRICYFIIEDAVSKAHISSSRDISRCTKVQYIIRCYRTTVIIIPLRSKGTAPPKFIVIPKSDSYTRIQPLRSTCGRVIRILR